MQGFNMGRYVPPDQEGLISGNALNKKHALGARASKLASHGILTVRFEMPFAVWCGHCPKPTIIGQGVRFNAQKKRTGSYHNTPIWSFTMRHVACGGEIEIRTDPQNTAYLVVSGGRKRDTGVDDESLVKSGEFAIVTDRERAEQRETAFGKLEKTIEDRQRVADARERLGELHDAAERQWEDPYAQNQRLRKAFRVGRHEREKEAVRTGALQDRMSLGIELLPGTEDDARRAALVDFGSVDTERDIPVEKALARPLFETTRPVSTAAKPKQPGKKAAKSQKKLQSELAAEKMRENLVSEVVGNARAARDPFLGFGSTTPRGPVRLPGLKRKRPTADPGEGGGSAATATATVAAEAVVSGVAKSTAAKSTPATSALVSYDSDSD